MRTGTLLALGVAGLAAQWVLRPLPLIAQRPAAGAAARQAEVVPGPGTTWSLAAVGDAIITRRVAQFDNAATPENA